MAITLDEWLDNSILRDLEEHYYKAVIRIIFVPPELEGRKIADLTHDIGSLRKEDVLVVSLRLAKILEKRGIAEIIKELY